jgi:hypothetical protein
MADKCNTVDSELSDLASNLEAEVHLLEDEYKKDLLVHDKLLFLTQHIALDLHKFNILHGPSKSFRSCIHETIIDKKLSRLALYVTSLIWGDEEH